MFTRKTIFSIKAIKNNDNFGQRATLFSQNNLTIMMSCENIEKVRHKLLTFSTTRF